MGVGGCFGGGGDILATIGKEQYFNEEKKTGASSSCDWTDKAVDLWYSLAHGYYEVPNHRLQNVTCRVQVKSLPSSEMLIGCANLDVPCTHILEQRECINLSHFDSVSRNEDGYVDRALLWH